MNAVLTKPVSKDDRVAALDRWGVGTGKDAVKHQV
jgi:hypothetical protein